MITSIILAYLIIHFIDPGFIVFILTCLVTISFCRELHRK